MLGTHCPICGYGPFASPYESLEEMSRSYDICPCCFCEYGFDDGTSYREKWIEQGAPWAHEEERPESWRMEEQLVNAIEGWETLLFRYYIPHEKLPSYQARVEEYLQQLEIGDPKARFISVRILENLDHPRINSALRRAIDDPDTDVASVARSALSERTGTESGSSEV